jgi:hypothetical protein
VAGCPANASSHISSCNKPERATRVHYVNGDASFANDVEWRRRGGSNPWLDITPYVVLCRSQPLGSDLVTEAR